MSPSPGAPTAQVERVFRENYGKAVAILVRLLGDIGLGGGGHPGPPPR